VQVVSAGMKLPPQETCCAHCQSAQFHEIDEIDEIDGAGAIRCGLLESAATQKSSQAYSMQALR